MRVVLLGPPGAGKGTQAVGLAEKLGVPHVATGDILRQAVVDGTEVGERAKSFMNRGVLVPDELIADVVGEVLEKVDGRGFVLDGFPRNVVQADEFDAVLERRGEKLDAVILLEVPDEVIVQRISERRTCPTCGRVYNLIASPPREDEICDDDGAEILQRADDAPDVVRRRLQVYRDETAPLVERYQRAGLLHGVDGVGSREEVEARILEEL